MKDIEGVVVEEPIVNENDENVAAPAAEDENINPDEPSTGGEGEGGDDNNTLPDDPIVDDGTDGEGRPNKGVGPGTTKP